MRAVVTKQCRLSLAGLKPRISSRHYLFSYFIQCHAIITRAIFSKILNRHPMTRLSLKHILNKNQFTCYYFYLPNHFGILHRVWQWYSFALCNISEVMDKWNFIRIEFKMSLWEISSIAKAPLLLYPWTSHAYTRQQSIASYHSTCCQGHNKSFYVQLPTTLLYNIRSPHCCLSSRPDVSVIVWDAFH